MKEYDVIAIGSGSAMNIISAMQQQNEDLNAAVIDKDDPGGICLTRGCIPSKILLYPADVVRTIQRSKVFGIDAKIGKVDFDKVMDRMRTSIKGDIEAIRHGLSHAPDIDYYDQPAAFTAPYTLKVSGKEIKSDLIFLCTGSKPLIPPIKGLDKVNYHTSDTIIGIKKLPGTIAIIGGGYIAAEYGHFFSAMGSKVIILGRNPRLLKQEEPEISALAKHELGKHVKILTNHEVGAVEEKDGKKRIIAKDRGRDKKIAVTADEVLVAAGRASNSDILHPEKAGIKTDKRGWILTNKYLETSQPGIWALGDATGKHLFKHVANYESRIVFYNAAQDKKMEPDYHAVPHAVFTHPEIAGVGMGEKEALKEHGEDKILIGLQRYEDTAKGEAMALKKYFAKVIVTKKDMSIIGAHIIGPQASVLIHEVINLMYLERGSAVPVMNSMHIHPALSEVVERAFSNLMPPKHYHHMLEGHHHGN